MKKINNIKFSINTDQVLINCITDIKKLSNHINP